MSEGVENGKPRLALEDVAQAARELAAQPELDVLVARFLDLVRAWASPSAVLAAARAPQTESGWRLLPALSVGSAPLGIERSLARMVEETPECLVRPIIVQPPEEIPGVKVRDNCIVPWWHEGETGLLVLRGVPRPYPPNLADALALVSAPVWPRLLGGPVARVEALVAELQALSSRLQGETARQLERLQAARPPEPVVPATEAPIDAGRLAELEAQLAAAQGEARRAVSEQEQARLRLERAERARRTAEEARRTAEEERDLARGEAEQLATRVGSQAPEPSAPGRIEEHRRAADLADARVRMVEEALAAARQELAETRGRGEEAEAKARELSQRWEGSLAAFRVATAVVRRASFVPPALRVSMEEAAALVEAQAERPARWLRVALLDRDAVALEPLAAELEAAGLDVRLANHSEEVALLLKTPDGRELGAAVCDVMAFRPDQNVAGLFRAWGKDRPGLPFYLSYNSENPAEAERARRVPTSLTVGHLPRPLGAARLVETLEVLTRRQSKA